MGRPGTTTHWGGRLLLFLGLISFASLKVITPRLVMLVNPLDALCIPREREALLSFKRDLADAPDNNLSSWVVGVDCCRWYGVVCNNSTGNVLQLQLGTTTYRTAETLNPGRAIRRVSPETYDSGSRLNPSLLNLTHLTHLDLSGVDFAGNQLPTFLGSLRKLTCLDLSGGNFEGAVPHQLGNFLNNTIPESIGNLTSLTTLKLSANSLSGKIPESFGNLTRLTYLDLSHNYINQIQILSFLGSIERLTSLTTLDLSYNNLSGEIPHLIGKLMSLTTLDLSYNNLSGEIPHSIGKLTSLTTLDLSFNKLSGEIPESFGKLTSLTILDLSYNNLSGEIPHSIGKLTSLTTLDLSYNNLPGEIPQSFGRLLSLERLYLQNNQLNGTLPESLGQLANLSVLKTSYNPLDGEVTELQFANLRSLTTLEALGNRLHLKVSPSWVPPFQLDTLQLDSWKIGPQFPQWLRSQHGLTTLQISSSRISSALPNWFWNSFPNCTYYDLSQNLMHGSLHQFPRSINVFYVVITLGSNQFTGALPPIPTDLIGLDLSNNSLSGNISHFLCHKPNKSKQLQYLNLKGNHLSGDIPDCWEQWQNLAVIQFENNQFTGNIPSSIGSLINLNSLHMRNNCLHGELPAAIGNCTKLVTIDLSENDFVGSIPTWIRIRLASMKLFSLRSNRFLGDISYQLCNLTSLQLLDLANNNLSGSIPACFGNFSAMIQQFSSNIIEVFSSFEGGSIPENAIVVIKGITLEYNKNLGLLASMDLSENNLSGGIPKELTCLVGLISLNLSKNLLAGEIPKKIGDMKKLESIDLSLNRLSGEIPSTISYLSFIAHLNLSHNNLEGRIPSSTQLQSFDSTCFDGNHLCGPPLTNNCGPNWKPPDGVEVDGHRDRVEVDGLYVTMATGFIVGFWFVWAPLLFMKTWRLTYFKFLENLWQRVYRQ